MIRTIKPQKYSQLLLVNFLICMGLGVGCMDNSSIHIYCDVENDVYEWLSSSKLAVSRHDEIELALNNCDSKDALMILAKDYPNQKTVLPPDFYQVVREKQLQVYLEFPDYLPSGKTGSILETSKERLGHCVFFF